MMFAFASCDDGSDSGPDGPQTYTITVTSGEGGTATSTPATAEAGKMITLNATADEGYAFTKWFVEEGDDVILGDANSAETKFIMPNGNVSVKATFDEEIPDLDDILPLITDASFKKYVQNRVTKAQMDEEGEVYLKWDKNGDGKLSTEEAAEVDWMLVTNGEDQPAIASLNGIQFFTGLKTFICNENASVAGLDLSKNKNLSYLNISGHRNLKTLDVTKCTELEYLNISGADLSTLDLSNNGKIQTLIISGTPLTTIDITALTELTSISLGDSMFTGIDISKCTKLKSFNANYNRLKSVDVSKNVELTSFSANNGTLEGVLDFSNCPKITNIDVMGSVMNSKSKLTKIIVTNCPDLTHLTCSYNQITELDVTRNTKLIILNCRDNKIKKLDVSNCTKLYRLYAETNRLTELDVTNCKEMLTCWVYANHIEEIDVRNLILLFDEEKQQQTEAWDYWGGMQLVSETPASEYSVFDPGATPDLFKTIKVKIRPDMMPWWDHFLKGGVSRNYKVEIVVE